MARSLSISGRRLSILSRSYQNNKVWRREGSLKCRGQVNCPPNDFPLEEGTLLQLETQRPSPLTSHKASVPLTAKTKATTLQCRPVLYPRDNFICHPRDATWPDTTALWEITACRVSVDGRSGQACATYHLANVPADFAHWQRVIFLIHDQSYSFWFWWDKVSRTSVAATVPPIVAADVALIAERARLKLNFKPSRNSQADRLWPKHSNQSGNNFKPPEER